MRVMLRRSDAFCAKGDISLKSRKREQKSDERILDRHAALSPLFQGPEVFEGQRLTPDNVRQTIAPDDCRTLYRSAHAVDVTRITALMSFFRPSIRL
jgi:hypothetical protein